MKSIKTRRRQVAVLEFSMLLAAAFVCFFSLLKGLHRPHPQFGVFGFLFFFFVFVLVFREISGNSL